MYEQNFDQIQHAQLNHRYQSAAKWFYWIAALTLITSVISLMGGGWRFFLSLGVTQVIDAFGAGLSQNFGNATKVIAIVLDIFVTAIFAGFGLLASKRQLWAYVLGMVVFLLDGLLSLAFFDILGILVHAYVLFVMFRGFQAGRELVVLEQTMAQAAAAQPAI